MKMYRFFDSEPIKKPKQSLVSKLGIRGICGVSRAIVDDSMPIAKPVNTSGRTKEQIVAGMEFQIKVNYLAAGYASPLIGYEESGL